MNGNEIEAKKTERGFEIAEFDDRYGERCSVQQSSAIGDDAIFTGRPGASFLWVGIDEPSVKIFPGNAT